jgi:uncharacterized protein
MSRIRETILMPDHTRTVLELDYEGGRIPAILLLPRSEAPVPAALLLHGWSLDKERMAGNVGVPLVRNGVASLTLDLPLHGERFQPLDAAMLRAPLELLRHWRGALAEASAALRYLENLPSVDRTRLALVGYSLGAFLGMKVAQKERDVRAIVLAAAGDLPDYTPAAGFVRTVLSPTRLVRSLEGRSLLMVHGRQDSVIVPQLAQRLFDAARQPKELRWWDSGHILPREAIEDAATWLSVRLLSPAA